MVLSLIFSFCASSTCVSLTSSHLLFNSICTIFVLFYCTITKVAGQNVKNNTPFSLLCEILKLHKNRRFLSQLCCVGICKRTKMKIMKTAIMVLAFVLIGMIGHAQEVEVNVDSIKVGDEIVFKKESKGIVDIYGKPWVFPKGASVSVTDIFRKDGLLISVDVVDKNGKSYTLFTDEIKYNQEKRRVSVIR